MQNFDDDEISSAKMSMCKVPVSAWKCVKIRDHLSKIHTLKPNRLEAETLSGIALSGREDVAKVAA